MVSHHQRLVNKGFDLMPPTRELRDSAGRRWAATVISHGRTSGYLNPRVHRPIVEFVCADAPAPRRYARLPAGVESLDGLDDAALATMLRTSKVH